MVLILNEKDVSEVVNMDAAIQTVEHALRDYSQQETIMPPRYVMDVPGSPGTVRVMLAALPKSKVSGLKALTGTAGKRRDSGVYFTIMLFEPDGALRCIMSANRLTQLRTGAASAVATKYLARTDSRVVGIIGGGVQGFGQIEAVCRVRDFERGLIFDIVRDRAEQIARSADSRFGVKFKMAQSTSEVVRNSDVLITATTSTEPIVQAVDVKAGTHINAIGSNIPTRRELDDEVLRRSKVVVDSIEQAPKESGDLLQPITNGTYNQNLVYGEVGEIIAMKKPGRVTQEEITLFKSVGIAVEDIAVAELAYSSAVRMNIGKEIDF